MADMQTVIVRLQAEVGQYKAAMNQAAASTARVGTTAEKSAAAQAAASKRSTVAAEESAVVGSAASKKQAASAAAATAATTKHTSALKGMGTMIAGLGLAVFAKSSVDAFSKVTTEVAKMQRVTGGTPETVSRLRYALKMTGVDIEKFTRSTATFDKQLVKAGASAKGTAAMNQMLGTSIKDSHGQLRPMTELLPDIADKFHQLGPGIKAAALAQTLFGRAGRDMLPMLLKGRDGVQGLMAATDKSSIVSAEQIAKNKELVKSQRELNIVVEGLKLTFGQAFVPALTEVAKAITPVVAWFTRLNPTLKSAAIYVLGAALAWKLLGPSIMGVGRAFTGIIGRIGGATAATVADTAALEAHAAAAEADAVASKGRGIGGAAGIGGKATGGAGALASGGAGAAGLASAAGPILAYAAATTAAIYGADKGVETLARHGKDTQATLLALALAGVTFGGSLGSLQTGLANVSGAAHITDDSIASMDTRLTMASGGRGGAAKVAQDLAMLKAKMAPEDFRKLIASVPMLTASLKRAGYEINQTTGAIQRIPTKKQAEVTAKIDGVQRNIAAAQNTINRLRQKNNPRVNAEIGPLAQKLGAAQRTVDRLRQKRKPDVDAINKAQARVATIQGQIDNVRQRNKISIDADASPAQGAIQSLWDSLSNLVSHGWTATVRALTGHAAGGWISGPGTGTSDSIPTMLSDGEYVVNARAAKANPELLDQINYGRPQRLAKGGYVNKPLTSAESHRAKAHFDAYAWAAKGGKYGADAKKAADNYYSKVSDRNAAISGTASSLSANASGFDFSAYAAAQQNTTQAVQAQTDAELALFEARRKLNSASKADRPEALREMAAAQSTYAKATTDLADAKTAEAKAAPTRANILANFQAKVGKAQAFLVNLTKLKKLGIPGAIIRDIIGQGIDAGSEMAAVLAGSSALDVKSYADLQGYLNMATVGIGTIDADLQGYGKKVALAKTPLMRAKLTKSVKKRAAGGPVVRGEHYLVGEQGPELLTAAMTGTIIPAAQTARALDSRASASFSQPIQLRLDSGVVWSGLVELNRRTGFTLRALDGSAR